MEDFVRGEWTQGERLTDYVYFHYILQAGGHTEMTQMFYWCFMKTSKSVMKALFAVLLGSWES